MTKVTSKNMKRHLKTVYGFGKFRDFQDKIIKDTINGDDTIVIFPTGGGKSLCYQFPATYMNKKTIVISPLISLMYDQKRNLDSKGIKSVCLNSENSYNKKTIENSNIIYSTPEYFTRNIHIFKNIENICLFAIDEAHCLSEWGHDFRRSYNKLSIIRNVFRNIPIMSLSATATPNVLEDILKVLDLDEVKQYQLSSIRDNLSIHVREKSDDILYDLDINKGESTIIYAQTRKNVEKIYNLLKSDGVQVGRYHAGLTSELKKRNHDLFVNDKIQVIVATVCFGMGIDKPDIRKVINYGSPCNLETYYQEIGRAGRDGKLSNVIMYYSNQDYNINSFILSKGDNIKEIQRKHKLLDIFEKYINNKQICRQSMIEYYFDNGDIPSENKTTCKICDNCTRKNVYENITTESKLVLSLIKILPTEYGMIKIIKILRGMDNNFKNNKYYGQGWNKSNVWWKSCINYLINNDFLVKKSCSYYTVIGIKNDVDKIIYMNDVTINDTTDTKYDYIRSQLSIVNNIPKYMILSENILDEIKRVKPSTFMELYNIDGISNDFISKYGTYFIIKKNDKRQNTNANKTTKTTKTSWDMYAKGYSIEYITKTRCLKRLTIESHIIDELSINTNLIDKQRIGLTDEHISRLNKAVNVVGVKRLKTIKKYVDKDNHNTCISYFQIKVFLI